MGMNGGTIQYGIKFTYNQEELNKIKQSLSEISNMTSTQLKGTTSFDTFVKSQGKAATNVMAGIRSDANLLSQAFNKAFDPTTGLTNISKLQQGIKSLDLGKIQSEFAAIGKQDVFTKMMTQAMSANIQFKETNNILNKIGQTLGNTIRWQISSSVINQFAGAIQQAWGYVQHLDSSLNDIRIVTGKSADEMDKFASSANKAAQSLGAATTDYTEAALIYYQQGLSDEEAQARAETTIKAANVTGQTGRQVSEELTAVWNGYKVTAEETEEYVDKLAAVAATTASDLEELSTGMSKVASAANAMGVDVDQLNAQLSTIISVTRQAPETAGTALKTIYARIEDLKVGGEDESGVKLGDVSATLDEVGVSIFDAQGELRELGEVIEEVAGKWNTWTDAQQNAIAQAMAGKRQYNNLLALFENWDMYESALETSKNATGTLQEQQDIYMESTSAHLQQLSTQWEELYQTIVDTKDINKAVDLLTSLLDKMTLFTNSIGGGSGALLGLGAVATKVFRQQIAVSLGEVINKFKNGKANAAELTAEINITKQALQQMKLGSNSVSEIAELKKQMQGYYDVMSQNQINEHNQKLMVLADLALERDRYAEIGAKYEEYVSKISSKNIGTNPNLFNAQANNFKFTDVTDNSTFEKLIKLFELVEQEAQKTKTDINNIIETINRGIDPNTGLFQSLEDSAQKAIQTIDELSSKVVLTEEQQEAIEKAKASIEQGKNDNDGEAIISALKDVKSIASEVVEENDNIQDSIDGVVEEYQDAQDQVDSFKESFLDTDDLDTEQMVGNLTDVANGLSSVAFGIQSIQSLGDIWNNENLTSAEKITSTVTNLSLALPMLASGLTTLATSLPKALSSIPGLFTSLTTNIAQYCLEIVAANNATAMQSIAATGLSKVTEEQGKAIWALIPAEEKLTQEYSKQALVQSIYTGKLSEETMQVIANTLAKQGNITATELFGNAQVTAAIKTGLLTNALKLLTNPITWVTIALVGVGVAAATYNKHVVNAAKSASEASSEFVKSASEQADASQELANNVKELTEAYQDLKNEYGPEDLDTLKSKIYDLCVQYGVQIDYLELMQASYKELDDIIQKVNADASKKAAEDALKENEATLEALTDSFKLAEAQGQTTFQTLIKWGYEFGSSLGMIISATTSGVKTLREELEDLFPEHFFDDIQFASTIFGGGIVQSANFLDAKSRFGNNETVSDVLSYDTFSGQYSLDEQKFYKEYTKEQQQEVKQWLEDNATSLDNTEQILNAIRENAQQNNDYQDLLKSNTEDIVNDIYNQSFAMTDLSTAEEYTDTKEQLAEQIKDKLNVDMAEAEKLAEEKIFSETGGQWGAISDSTLASELGEIYGKSAKQMQEELADLPEATKNFIADNLSLAGGYDDLSDFVKDYDDVVKHIEDQSITVKINTIFENEKKGSGFKEEDIADLYNTTDFEEKSGISQENFLNLSLEEQRAALLDYYTVANQNEDAYNDKVIANIEQRKQALDGYGEILSDLNSKYDADTLDHATNGYLDNQINTIEESVKELGLAKKDIQDALEDYYTSDGASADYDNRIKLIQEETGLTNEQLKRLGELQSAQNNYNKATKDFNKTGKSYNALLEDIEEEQSSLVKMQDKATQSVTDWAKVNAQAKKRMSENNDIIDDIQDAYNDLTSVIEDYNNDQVLSMDNLQTILDMDDSYLAALQIENGQLSLNESTLQQLTLARLDEAEATAVEEAMSALLALQQQETTSTTESADSASKQIGVTISELTTLLEQGAAAWNTYWKAEADDLDIEDKNWQTTTDALYNRLSLINSVRNQVTSGQFGTTMEKSSSKSSSSSSSSEPDTEEYLEEEVDLYREINAELDEIESKLSRIQETENHSWGASMQEALEAENKLLDDQLAKLEEKKQIQLDDLATQKATLESYGIGVSADGSSVTDTSALTDLYTTYNSMVDKYNAMSKDEQDSYKDQLDNQKDLIDNVEDAIEDYEDTYSDYQSTLDDLLDAHYAEIENAVKSFNNMIDVHLELKDAEQEWNDFWEEVVEDVDDTDFGGKIAASMKQLTTLVGLGGDTSNSSIGMLTAHVNETVGEVWKQINNADNGGQGSLFGDDTALSKETLTDYRDKLMDALTTAKGEVDEISENYLSMLDSAQDLLDEQVAGWEAIGDHIEHNVELIKLVSGEKSFEALDKQYQLQYENNLELIETQKQGADFWSAQIQRYQTLLATTDESSVEWDTYSEALNKATENYRSAVKDLDSALEDTLKELDNLRTNKVNAVMDELDKSMSGGFGLDTLEEEWKMIDDHSSKYLDNVERAYSMEEYADILQDAASATGLTAENQAKINQFMEEELDKLNKKEKLTQYDIDESKARLEILKQQIALEDAQANKSSMRLRRDSQGNYTYQYVGNQDAVDDAEKGGLTARKEWYQLVKKQYKDTTDWILNLEKEQKQLLTEIDTAEKNGETERLEILKQMYDRNLHDIEDAYRETEKNKRDLVDGTAKFFAQVENASVLPQSAATVRTLVNQWVNNEDSFVKAVTNGIVELESIQEEYVDKTQKALAKAGVGYQDLYKKGIDPTTKSLQDLTDSNEELGEKLDETNNKLTTQEENLRAAEAAYKALKEAAVDAITKANEALETLAETAVKTKTTVEEATNVNSNANVNTSTSTSSTDSGSTGTNIGNTSAGTAKTNTHGYRVYTDPSGVAGKYYATDLQGHLIGNLKFVDLDTIINWLIQHGYHKSDGTWNVSKSVREFKSGGYTGEWNNGSEESNGRLAFLHQKELVLNESDTANILQAVNAVRDLVSSSANTRGIADKLVAAGNMSAQVLAQVGSGILQGLANIVTTNQDNSYRNTTINADFSGVRSADAIYQALRELESYGDQQSYSSAPSANVGY